MFSNHTAFFLAYHKRLNRKLKPWQLMVVAVLMMLGITAILSLDFIRASQIDVAVGNPSPQRIVAPKNASYASSYLTALEQDAAAAAVVDVYTPIDRSIGRTQVNKVQDLFNFIEVVRSDGMVTAEEKISYLQEIETIVINRQIAGLLLDLSSKQLSDLRDESKRITDKLLRSQIRNDQLDSISEEVRLTMGFFSGAQETILLTVVPPLIVPNSTFDEAATKQARSEAREVVEPVRQSIIKDQVILDEGDIATNEDLEKLEVLGILQAEANWWQFSNDILLAILSVSLIFLYYVRYRERFYRRLRYMLLLLVLVLMFVFSAELLVGSQSLVAYMLPAAALAMMLAVIFDGRFAILVMLVLSGLVGYIGNNSLEMGLYTVVGSLLAVLTLRDTQRINAFFRAGLLASVGNLAVVTIFNLDATTDPLDFLQLVGLSFASGGLSAMLTIGGFYMTGALFGITTMLQLQELSRFDQPLLQELLHKAPGTYHHSIMVANLAEQAADRIGANSLLARVGAFYHDIGKMPDAPYFSENQEGSNPHDVLDPFDSAGYIVGHVTQGLEMAGSYRLPERIQDFIAEHHGTQVLTHFYQKARNQSAENNNDPIAVIDEARFTYPGPAPRSRETGIVMIADSVEATSKAVQPNNVVAIEKLVRSITDNLLAANQLDNSGLTLGDIQQIRESFVETLKGRFHVRVKYAGNDRLEAANTPAIEAEITDLPADDLLELDGDEP